MLYSRSPKSNVRLMNLPRMRKAMLVLVLLVLAICAYEGRLWNAFMGLSGRSVQTPVLPGKLTSDTSPNKESNTTSRLQSDAAAYLTSGAASRGPTVNVRDFGATPNDNTDDTSAIKHALQAVIKGGEVHFPAGKFIMQSNATPDGRENMCIGGPSMIDKCGKQAVSIRITGEGMNATTIKTLDTRARYNNSSEGITNLVLVLSAGTVELHNLALEGPDDPAGGTWRLYTSYGIRQEVSSGNLVLDGVKISKFTHAIRGEGGGTAKITIKNSSISGHSMGVLMTSSRGTLYAEHTDFHDTGAFEDEVCPALPQGGTAGCTLGAPLAKNDHHIYLYATVTAEIVNCNFWNNGGYAIQKLEGGSAYTYVSNSRIGNEAIRNAGGSFYNGMPAPSTDRITQTHHRNVGQARGIMTTFSGGATYVEDSKFAVNGDPNSVGAVVHNGLKLVLVNVEFLKGTAIIDGTLWNPKEIVLKNVAFNNDSYSIGFLSGQENFAHIYMEDCTFSAGTVGFFLPKAQPHEVHWFGTNSPRMSTFNTSNGGTVTHESGPMPSSMYARPC